LYLRPPRETPGLGQRHHLAFRGMPPRGAAAEGFQRVAAIGKAGAGACGGTESPPAGLRRDGEGQPADAGVPLGTGTAPVAGLAESAAAAL